jgi:NTE family protein
MQDGPDVPGRSRPNKRIALVLQGGGALGSYQAGVYEALHEAEYLPDWVAGISIGAINAAIIAGNAPGNRVARLKAFWDEVTSLTAARPNPAGQPPDSFHDTTALRQTLERLVDFDRINARETRLSVGAVNVRTGRFHSFDNHTTTIRPEHIMASGALPQEFPPVDIDGDPYWDGGLVSNTPLLQVLEHEPRESIVVFQVDLFQAYGRQPATMDEVLERQKDIMYASRTRGATRVAETNHNIGAHAQALWEKLPDQLRALPEARFLDDLRCVTEMDIVLLIYRPFEPQGSRKDVEFGHGTAQARWDRGREDAEITLAKAPWSKPFPKGHGTRVSDVLHELYIAQMGRDAAAPSRTTAKPAA